MIKRMNKLTALLATATAVASIAPAGVHAADYKRVKSEDGTVYSAKAFKDGSYVIDGNIVDEDTDAVYYVKDGKYTELEDVDTGSTLELYGDHYLSVDNGDYFIDLNTGKVTDEDLADNNEDDLKTTLKKQFKKVDRYGSMNQEPSVTQIAGPKYGELWYSVDGVKIYESDNADVKEGETNATIYSDLDGNYIDADYNLGKIRVITSKQVNGSEVTKTSTIENSEDKEDAVGSSKVRGSVAAGKVIGQDDNNIYRLATITVTVDANNEDAQIKSINGVDVKNSMFEEKAAGTSYSFEVIQKISKAQASDEIEDAKYAKTVTSYMICDEDKNAYSNDDSFYGMVKANANVTVVDGKLVAYTENGKSVTAVSTQLKTKGVLNYLDDESSVTEDGTLTDTDVNGNLYRLEDGYIYKFDNTDDWDKLYRVDGSMKEMSIYDSNDMVVWDKDNEVYSLVGFNASNTSDDSNADNSNNSEDTVAPVAAGWNQAADGTYTYVNADGTLAKGWFQSPYSGKWFYMDLSTGVMQTGWVQSPYSGKWFFMDPSNGDMQTGWVQSPYSGKWFYMNPSNGDMMTGWIQSPYSGKWYYMGSDGAMLTNTTVNGYVLGADGAWVR